MKILFKQSYVLFQTYLYYLLTIQINTFHHQIIYSQNSQQSSLGKKLLKKKPLGRRRHLMSSSIRSCEFSTVTSGTERKRGFVSIVFCPSGNPVKTSRQIGYSQSASLLAHNLIAAIAAFPWESALPRKQGSPNPPLSPWRLRSGGLP